MNDSLRAGLRVSLLGMVCNVGLATIKLVGGLIGSSYALVADAVESFADIASSAIVWSGLRISGRPPDANHPYGHGKAEPLAGLTVGAMLIAAAIGITVPAVRSAFEPHAVPAGFTLVILIAVFVVKETLFRISSRVGTRLGSTAVIGDAWHHRSDALTSLIAFLGILVARYAGPDYAAADEWAAVVASCVIAYNGIRICRRAAGELMDAHPGAQLVEGVTRSAYSVPGVKAVEKTLARKMGVDFLVDMHVEVDGRLTVREAHELAHQVKDAVMRDEKRIIDVLVHIEPHGRTGDMPSREHTIA